MLCSRIGKFFVCAAAFAAATGIYTSTSSVRADAIFDLRATTVNGAALSGLQSPHAIPDARLGDVIAFDVFVLITGTDANFTNDRFISGIGSFRSSNGGLGGNVLMDVVRTPVDENGDPIGPLGFDEIGYSVGLQQDLDGDGDLDVGSNNASTPANYWAVRYPLATGAQAGLPNGRKVGFGTFTVTFAPPQTLHSQTLIKFAGRNATTALNYLQDGQAMATPSMDSTPANSILVTALPEPGSAALFGIVAVSLWPRRRRA